MSEDKVYDYSMDQLRKRVASLEQDRDDLIAAITIASVGEVTVYRRIKELTSRQEPQSLRRLASLDASAPSADYLNEQKRKADRTWEAYANAVTGPPKDGTMEDRACDAAEARIKELERKLVAWKHAAQTGALCPPPGEDQ